MKWFLKCLKNYATFNGRARRKEYWMFALVAGLISFVLALIDRLLNSSAEFGVLSGIFALVLFLPSLAVLVRRLHDINKSGWWYFIVFIPIIGPIYLFVLMCKEGDRHENQYGLDPKSIESEIM